MTFQFQNGEITNKNSSKCCYKNKWISNPLPPSNDIHKVKMLIEKSTSTLYGIRMYNKSGCLIFTIGGYIQKDENRKPVYFSDFRLI